MAPLPLLKIFGLVVKTMSKPLTNRLKKEAKRFQKFSNFCTSVGQITHQISSRATALASGYKVKEINPLAEEDALARGISFVSETFMFFIAGGIIVIEFIRSEEKNAQKAEATRRKEEEFRLYLEERFHVIDARMHQLEERLAKIEADKSKSILPSVLFPESFSSKRGLAKKNPYAQPHAMSINTSASNTGSTGEAIKEEPAIYEAIWQWGVDFFATKQEQETQQQAQQAQGKLPEAQRQEQQAKLLHKQEEKQIVGTVEHKKEHTANSSTDSNTTNVTTTSTANKKYVP